MTGRARCPVASKTASYWLNPLSRFDLICSMKMSVFLIRIPARPISARIAFKPNAWWKKISVGTAPRSPRGAVSSASAKLRTI